MLKRTTTLAVLSEELDALSRMIAYESESEVSDVVRQISKVQNKLSALKRILENTTPEEPVNWTTEVRYTGDDLASAIRDGRIINTHFLGEDLQGANLALARLAQANLQGADLQRADLTSARLFGANLQGTDLGWANLSTAVLREADLQGASLRKANLHQADLQKADLQGADLQGADLRWANLRGADLRGANLQEANLKEADIRGAIYSRKTSFPLSLRLKEAYNSMIFVEDDEEFDA